MRARLSFENTAKMGYAIVALLLALGMALLIRRLFAMADDQIARLRREENEITLVERMRWNSELIVSNGRGYLISGDPDLLAQVRVAEGRLDASVRALRRETLDATGRALVASAEQAAARFAEVQGELLGARQRETSSDAVVRRFERELLPLSRELERSIVSLVDHKEETLRQTYDQERAERRGLERGMYALLGLLVLAGLAVAWRFGRLLGSAYREQEQVSEAARNAAAAREELLGIVAHDLRNPLGAITMKAAVLKRRAESEKIQAAAESIEKVAKRMEYLIGTMLDAATIEAGRFSVEPARCEAEDLVRETAEVFGSLAASQRVRFEPVRPEADLAVMADRERVLQVLSNLLGNALKYTPAEGRVRLSVERLNGEVCFWVSDSGPGIPREHMTRIFDRYWKHDSGGKRGTGLGLFIAKGIVEAHGGRIWVERPSDGGARFGFTLPAAPQPDQGRDAAHPPSAPPPA